MKQVFVFVLISLSLYSCESNSKKITPFNREVAEKLIAGQPANERRLIDTDSLATMLQRTASDRKWGNSIKDEGRIKALYMADKVSVKGTSLLLLHVLANQIKDHNKEVKDYKLKLKLREKELQRQVTFSQEVIGKSRLYIVSAVAIIMSIAAFVV